MRIMLVSMPWQSLDSPSLALGILHARAASCADEHATQEYYGNVRWAEYLLEASGGQLSPISYGQVADDGIFFGMGDWIFTSALYGTPEWKAREYSAYAAARGFEADTLLEMQRLAPGFIEQAADDILAFRPDLVGFTTTFMQNVPTLALARRLKQRQPSLTTVLGGGNCDGPMGSALHRNFSFVDYVVRGEGEQAFPDLLDALNGRGQPADIAGLCWRSNGESVANEAREVPFPIARVPAPDYDSYFSLMDESPVREFVEPKIVLEAARGCWWGEKSQCTFCGLNGSLIKFRSKSPTAVWHEMSRAVEKYRVLDVIMVDNIMDTRYFEDLLPHVAAADWDLRVHYEIKSNLNTEQVRALQAARVTHVQPGIESLSSRVLRLMKKGVTGCHNVQLLRDGQEHNLTVTWNYLYGFPGEEPGDYNAIVDQMPSLVHLQPPAGASRIALERFSPYFESPELGFADRQPAEFYHFVFDLPPAELADLCYLFDATPAGITGATESRLQAAIDEWRRLHLSSSLTYRCDGSRVLIRDGRANRPAREYVLDSELDAAMYLTLTRHHALPGLHAVLRKRGLDVPIHELERKLATWKELGLVFEDGKSFVALATHDHPRAARLPLN